MLNQKNVLLFFAFYACVNAIMELHLVILPFAQQRV
jgi:hypothetical protein